MTSPLISIIIVAYNMAREVPRTVQSFLVPYQQGIQAGDVEVLVMENGSPHPTPPDVIKKWPDNVRYIPRARPGPLTGKSAEPWRAAGDGHMGMSGD